MVVFPASESADAWELVCGRIPPASNRARSITPSRSALTQGPVLIFTAAADPDALASVRTLTALLKADLLRYEVHPVAGYSHLRDKFNVLVRGDDAVEPRAVLCVNCAAAVDIQSILGLSPEQGDPLEADFKVFVIDSHRPYHLANIHSERIIIFDHQEDFNHAHLPITLGLENEWGFVPDIDSSDEEDGYYSQHSAESDPEQHDEPDANLEGFVVDDSEPTIRHSQRTDRSHQRQRFHATERASSTAGDTAGPAESQLQSGASPAEQNHVDQDESDDSEREAYLEQVIEDDVDLGGGAPEASDSESEEENIRRGNRKRRAQPTQSSSQHLRTRKRKRRSRRSRFHHQAEVEERKRLREYYSSSSLALSSACLCHRIADSLKRGNIDTLWMAIVGATSQHFTSDVSEEALNEYLTPYRGQVQLLNDTLEDDGDNDRDNSDNQNAAYIPKCHSGAVNRIAESAELRLDLLRHWSLYHSLLYSSYTCTRLATWRQTGKRRMLEMLATLGIPLRDSQQRWCYMKQTHKLALENRLQKAVERFDLGYAVKYDSFVRSLPGHRGDISASDFVYAVTALLEFDEPSQKASPRTSYDSLLLDRFWRAYDALDPRKTVLLEAGLDMAISAQQLTAEIGGEVIERRKFVPSGPFRYVFLRDQQFKEFLRNPLLLRRLAQFLKSALSRQGAKDKPFIILAPDSARRIWIAVSAVTYGQKNDFGQRFIRAAEKNGSQVTYDGFDSSVCEIPDGQEIEFVRYLHDVMR
ncbi:DNA replication pre-initiation complex subunit Cdc45 [Gracilaria domingensis]|nr:DNA replication pre-initiation complex subunit Cdc45 [Gracilaria domingensis]